MGSFCLAHILARTVCSVCMRLGADFAMIVGSWWRAKSELLSGVTGGRRVARLCVQKRVGRGDRNTTSLFLRDGVHLSVFLHFRVARQAVVVRSSMSELAMAVITATSVAAAAEMARQPRARHLGIWTLNEATRMNNVPHKNGQPHWSRLQDVQDGLITWQRVACAQATGELIEGVDDANGDGQQACVEGPDQPFPAACLVGIQTSGSFCLKLVAMKLDDQAQEQNNEALLHANTTHVNVQALFLRLGTCAWTSHSATDELNDKGENVQGDEDESQNRRRQDPDLAGGRVEVDDASKDHVCKGIDPWGRMLEREGMVVFQFVLTDGRYQDQDLSNKCNSSRLLILGAKSAESIGKSLPETSHYDDPAETIAIHDRLTQVREGDDSKQNGKGHCCGEAGEVYPQRIACRRWNVAIDARGDV